MKQEFLSFRLISRGTCFDIKCGNISVHLNDKRLVNRVVVIVCHCV